MIDGLFDRVRHGGARALTRSAWTLAGAQLGALAAGLGVAALTVGLTQVMPVYAAMGCGALVLALLAGLCVYFATHAHDARQHTQAAAALAAQQRPLQLQDFAYQMLATEIAARPGKTAAAAVVAGLMMGALEALEHGWHAPTNGASGQAGPGA
jgi:hypothetical protein